MTHKLCRGDLRIARSHYGKIGRFVNRPYRMMETVCAVMRQHRILTFPIGEVCPGTRCVPNEFPLRETSRATDEGMQAAGTAWCEALLSSIPHQALTLRMFFGFATRNRRCSADEEKLRETLRVSYSSPPQGKPKRRDASRTPHPLHRGAKIPRSPNCAGFFSAKYACYFSPGLLQ